MFCRWKLILLIPLFAVFHTAAAGPADASRRMALIIGNSDYETVPLANPVNDARLIADALEGVGFEVTLHLDLEHYEFGRVVSDFGAALSQAGDNAVGLFYYAGHAVQANGQNYLIPVNAQPRDVVDLQFQTISMDIVLSSMDRVGPDGLKLIFLDACRDNPFAAMTRSTSRGLSRIQNATGTFISYATAPGQVAEDGTGQNSPFARSLARRIQEPNLLLEQVMRLVRLDVMERTGNRQEPWTESSLGGDFYFLRREETQPAPAAQAPVRDADVIFWESIRNSDNPALYDVYLQQFPNGQFAALAQARKAELNQQNAARDQAQAASAAAEEARQQAAAAAEAQAAAEAAAAARESELAAERQRLAELEAQVQQLAALQQQNAALQQQGAVQVPDVSQSLPTPTAGTQTMSFEEVLASETERFRREITFANDGIFIGENLNWKVTVTVEDGDVDAVMEVTRGYGSGLSVRCHPVSYGAASDRFEAWCGTNNGQIAQRRLTGTSREINVPRGRTGGTGTIIVMEYQLTEADRSLIQQRAQVRFDGGAVQQTASLAPAAPAGTSQSDFADLPLEEGALRAALLEQETANFLTSADLSRDGTFTGESRDGQVKLRIEVSNGDVEVEFRHNLTSGFSIPGRQNCGNADYDPETTELSISCTGRPPAHISGVGLDMLVRIPNGPRLDIPVSYELTDADRAEIAARADRLTNQILAQRAAQ